MASMDLRTFVSDNLIKLVGGSDDMTIDFVTQTAKSVKSPSALLDKLTGMLDSEAADLKRFSDDLYSKVASKSGSGGASNGSKKESAAPKKEAKK
ncbi:hypothetical protein KC336_g22083, partial [Hortaea werneckii]